MLSDLEIKCTVLELQTGELLRDAESVVAFSISRVYSLLFSFPPLELSIISPSALSLFSFPYFFFTFMGYLGSSYGQHRDLYCILARKLV